MKPIPLVKRALLSVPVFIAAFSGTAVRAQTAIETVVYSTGLPELSSDQIASLHHDALAGSASAAKTLALRSGLGAGNVKGEIYWYSVEVENGDASARCNLAMSLTADDDLDSSIRARYWFNRIIAETTSADDIKCAKSGLQELDLVLSMRRKHA